MIKFLFLCVKIAIIVLVLNFIVSGIASAGSLPICDGVVIYASGDNTQAASCSTGWREIDTRNLENIAWTVSSLDVGLAVQFFSAGFAIFLVPWIASYGFGALINFARG